MNHSICQNNFFSVCAYYLKRIKVLLKLFTHNLSIRNSQNGLFTIPNTGNPVLLRYAPINTVTQCKPLSSAAGCTYSPVASATILVIFDLCHM